VQTQVSFVYDPLGRRISKTSRRARQGEAPGHPRTTYFVWEGLRLLQEIRGDVPLTYVYADPDSYEPLARIDGVSDPAIYWYHCAPNGTPERLTDAAGGVCWQGDNSAQALAPEGRASWMRRVFGASLHSFPVLRSGLRTVHAAGPGGAGGWVE